MKKGFQDYFHDAPWKRLHVKVEGEWTRKQSLPLNNSKSIKVESEGYIIGPIV